MPNDILTLRSSTPGARPTGRKPGELYVNWPDRQIGVVDAAGLPMDLAAVRQWSDQATYVQNDVVLYDGQMLICTEPTSLPPDNGKFRVKDWAALTRKMLLGPLDLYVDVAGNDDTGDGSAAAPWATTKPLVDYLSREIDFNGRQVAAHLGVGAFDALVIPELIGEGGLAIVGSGVDQTILKDGVNVLYSRATVSVSNMTVQMGDLSFMFVTGDIFFGLGGPLALDFTAASFSASIARVENGTLSAYGAIEVRQSGRPSNYYAAIGLLGTTTEFLDQAQWNLTGAPNGYPAWIASDGGRWKRYPSHTVAGSIVGKKFHLENGSIFDSDGGGLDILPGDQPGTWDSSSFYDGVQGGTPKSINPLVLDGPGATPFIDPTLPGDNASLVLNKPPSGANDIIGAVNGSTRWTMTLGNDAPEGVGAAPGEGSEFTLNRWDDTGKHLGPVLRANRATGLVTVAGDPIDPLGVVTKRMVRTRLQATTRFWIDAAGDDANDGSINAPWATMARLAQFIAETDFNNKHVVVRIGTGTFDGLYSLYDLTGFLWLIGDGIDQTILGGASYPLFVTGESHFAYVTCSGLTIKPPAGLYAAYFYSCDVFFLNVCFDVSTSQCLLSSSGSNTDFGGRIDVRQGGVPPTYSTSGIVTNQGARLIDQAQWTFTGPPNTYSSGWLQVIEKSTASINPTYWTLTGAAPLGRKYSVTHMSQLSTAGTSDLLPGDQPGTCDPTSYVDGVAGTDPYPFIASDDVLRQRLQQAPPDMLALLPGLQPAKAAPTPKTPPPRPVPRTPPRR